MDRVFYEIVSNDRLARLVLLGIAIFSFSILVYPSLQPIGFIEGIKQNMKESMGGDGLLGAFTLLPVIIAVNNIIASLFTLVGGFILVGYLAIMAFNGLLVAAIAMDAVSTNPVMPIYTALAVHGILEIPIIALAGSIGFGKILRIAGVKTIVDIKLEDAIAFIGFSIIILAFIESSLTILMMILDTAWRSIVFGGAT